MAAATATATVETIKVDAPTDEKNGKNGKEKHAFKVHVKLANGNKWDVIRKYSEFAALHELLKGQYPGVQFKFPPKKGLFTTNDEKFQEKRRGGLESFVQQLLSDSRIVQKLGCAEMICSCPSKLYKQVRELFYIDSNAAESATPGGDNIETTVADDSQVASDDERVFLGTSERKNARPSDFEYIKTIGKGSFGKVFMAVHKKEKKVYAVKVLAKAHIRKRNEIRHIMSERNVLVLNIKHPFLVGLHYSFQTRDKLYFVLSYLNGGELFFHLQREKRFSEARSRFYAAEIGSALGYLHEKNIIYRDLKPENLLLDAQGHVVLTDFGLCKENMKEKTTTSTFCGTPEYLAPEVVLRQAYDKTVDWWCLGSVLYEMLFGLPPFYSRDHKEMYDRIVNQPLKIANVISNQAKDLLTGMLQKDRHKRLGAKKDFNEIKSHAFFAPIDFDLLLQRKVTAPYIPKVADDRDTSYVDREFTNEPVSESVAKSPETLSASMAKENEFKGFTFVNAPVLEQIAE